MELEEGHEVFATDVISGDLANDMEKHSHIHPELTKILQGFSDIFGELPPPSKGKPWCKWTLSSKKNLSIAP